MDSAAHMKPRIARRMNMTIAELDQKVMLIVHDGTAATSGTAPGYGLVAAPELHVYSVTKAALLLAPGVVRLSTARWDALAAVIRTLPSCKDRPMACASAESTFRLPSYFMDQIVWAAALQHAGSQKSPRDVLRPTAKRLHRQLCAKIMGSPAKELLAIMGIAIDPDGTIDVCDLLGSPAGIELFKRMHLGPNTDDSERRRAFGPVPARIVSPGRVKVLDFWAVVTVDAILGIAAAMAKDECWARLFAHLKDQEKPGPRIYSDEREQIERVLKTANEARRREMERFGDSVTIDNAPRCITKALDPANGHPKNAARYGLGLVISAAIRLSGNNPQVRGVMAALIKARFESNGWNADGKQRGAMVASVIAKPIVDKRRCDTYTSSFCPYGGNIQACAKDLGIVSPPPETTAASMWAMNSAAASAESQPEATGKRPAEK